MLRIKGKTPPPPEDPSLMDAPPDDSQGPPMDDQGPPMDDPSSGGEPDHGALLMQALQHMAAAGQLIQACLQAYLPMDDSGAPSEGQPAEENAPTEEVPEEAPPGA